MLISFLLIYICMMCHETAVQRFGLFLSLLIFCVLYFLSWCAKIQSLTHCLKATISLLLNFWMSWYLALSTMQYFCYKFFKSNSPFLFANKISVKLLSLHSSVVQSIQVQALPSRVENNQVLREGVGSDHFSDSNSSFLANEKLMSVDSMNSDLTGKSDL